MTRILHLPAFGGPPAQDDTAPAAQDYECGPGGITSGPFRCISCDAIPAPAALVTALPENVPALVVGVMPAVDRLAHEPLHSPGHPLRGSRDSQPARRRSRSHRDACS